MVRPERARAWTRAGRAAGWLGAAALCAAAYLLWPRPRAAEDALPALVSVVIDGSASAARLHPDRVLRLRERLFEEARAAALAGREVLVVLFAGGAEVAFGPGPAEDLLARLTARDGAPLHPYPRDLPDTGSELAEALGLVALEERDPRPAGRLVLLADGTFTGADPAAVYATLAARVAEVAWEEPVEPQLCDLGITHLSVPDEVGAGAPLAVEVGLRWRGRFPVNLSLDVEADGLAAAPDERSLTVPPDLVPDALGFLRWRETLDLGRAPAGAGHVQLRVRCRVEGARDPVAENDVAEARVRVGEGRLVGWIASDSARERTRAWMSAVARPGLEVTELTRADLPARLGELDVLVTSDVAPSSLPYPLLRAHLERGAGWVCALGWGSLAGFGTAAAREGQDATDLLPLRPAREEERPREVVFLVDGSGSMAGEPFTHVRAALADLVRSVRPNDRLSLRFFTGVLGEELDLGTADRPARREAALQELFRKRLPGGTTAVVYSLEQLAVRRRAAFEADGARGLVLMLTDGQDRSAFDVAARAGEVRAALAASQTELTVVAVGPNPNLTLLGALAGPDAEPETLADLSGIAEVLRRAVHRDRVDERSTPVVPATGPEPGLAARVLEAQAATWPGEWPGVSRFVRSELAPGAGLLWATGDGRPLLAHRRVGRGHAVAFAASAEEGWAEAWCAGAAGGTGELWAVLLRALARETPAAGPKASVEGRSLRVTGVPADSPTRLHGRLVERQPAAAGALFPPREEELATLVLLPPARALGGAPTTERVAVWPGVPPTAGRGLLALEVSAAPGEPPLLSVSLPRARAPEFRDPPRRLVRGSSVRTGSGRPSAAREGHPSAPAWLAAGLLLLFLGALSRGRAAPPG